MAARAASMLRYAAPRVAVAEGQRLLHAMLAAKPEHMEGAKSGAQCIRLAGGAQWLQLGAKPLMVRHFYEQCAAGAMSDLEPGRRFIIRGNGGMNGKRTVVYVSDKAQHGYIFRSDGRVEEFVRVDLLHAADKVLEDRNTVLIFDGDGDSRIWDQGRPPWVDATTVQVTSPVLDRYSDFEKSGVTPLVLPVFSRAEIDDMLESCFPHLCSPAGRAGVEERYQRWGGIPRYVLALLDFYSQAQLDKALVNIDFDRMANVLLRNDIWDETSHWHRIFHLKPVGATRDGFEGADKASAYALAGIELGSEHIIKMVYTGLQEYSQTVAGFSSSGHVHGRR